MNTHYATPSTIDQTSSSEEEAAPSLTIFTNKMYRNQFIGAADSVRNIFWECTFINCIIANCELHRCAIMDCNITTSYISNTSVTNGVLCWCTLIECDEIVSSIIRLHASHTVLKCTVIIGTTITGADDQEYGCVQDCTQIRDCSLSRCNVVNSELYNTRVSQCLVNSTHTVRHCDTNSVTSTTLGANT